MISMRMSAIMAAISLLAGLSLAADTNVLSFAYTASVAASSAAPDTWGRKLNDGYWTNSVKDGVRYDGDSVAVTLDLAWRTQVSRVDVYTFTVGGGSQLSTQGVTLEWSNDSATWFAAGALSTPSNSIFTLSPASVRARYLRLTCVKGSSAVGQSLAEVVVDGALAATSGLVGFTYTSFPPSNPAHPDYTFIELNNGRFLSATSDSVQYGPSTNTVNTTDPALMIATNVVITVTLDSARKLRRAHLYAYQSSTGYVTDSVVLSNSLDGVTWTCAGIQTNVFETLVNGSSVTRRYDFILPNTEARYLAFACRKGTASNVYRQLLAEIQVIENAPSVGDPLPFTYEFDIAPTGSLDKAECPKLTDGTWESNTRNAVRIYGDVKITADLGAARYVVGTDLLCWSNRFTAGSDSNYVYSTGRVVVHSSLDKTTWTPQTEITKWSSTFPYHHAAIFTNAVYARYLRFETFRCTDTPAQTNTAQILGELTIFRPPMTVIGAEPVEAAGVITNGGFESPAIPDGDSASMLVKGGPADGWTFSNTDSANYAGYQRNRSPVSTNLNNITRYYAPEGSQTAVLMGHGTMQTIFNLVSNGTYTVQFKVNSTVIDRNGENAGYDFRVMLDGVVKGVVTVLQLTNTMRQVVCADVSAGSHTLRFEGLNSKPTVTWGALIDDVKIKRYEVSVAQIQEQGKNYVLKASSAEPLALYFDGALIVKELWLEGVLMPPSRYSSQRAPTIFEGPGAIGFSRATLLKLR